jgi:hypothetical protein
VRLLDGVSDGLTPLAGAVARTLDERQPRHGWEALQLIESKDHGSFDQAVDQQAMPGRVDERDSVMVPLEVQRRRSHDPVQ